LAVAGVAAGASSRAGQEGRELAPEVRIAKPDEGGFVSLTDGQVLAWNRTGQIQLRSSAGTWSNPTQLGVTAIDFATAGQEGAWVVGSRIPVGKGAITSALFRLGAPGAIFEYALPRELTVNSVSETGGTVWLSTNRGIEALGPDGAPSLRRPAPSTAVLPKGSSGPAVVCTPADLSASSTTPPLCSSTATPPWKAAGEWTGSPLICGSFLVEPARAAVTVRSIRDGRLMGTAKIPLNVALACGGEGELLIGAREVTALALPALTLRWRLPVRNGPVTALVRVGNRVIVSTPRRRVDLDAP